MHGEIADIAFMANQLAGDEAAGGETHEEFFVSLIERAKTGDAAAFEQMMLCTERRVARVAWRILGNREDARDATQEVFMRAFKYLHRFDSAQGFHGWLYRITVNVCRDMQRKSRPYEDKHAVSLNTQCSMLDARTAADDTEAIAVQAQRRTIVARALDTLPEKERAAIVLRDLEGLSTEEVARVLGSSQATVRSQISTARAKIKLYCERFLKQKRPLR